jgi:hypothetical protein
MYKIEIFPLINDEHLPLFLENIQNNKLYGTIEELFNGRYLKLRDVTHSVTEIITVENKMWAIVEFNCSKIGTHARIISDVVNLKGIKLKPFFVDENNLGLNLHTKLRGVVL